MTYKKVNKSLHVLFVNVLHLLVANLITPYPQVNFSSHNVHGNNVHEITTSERPFLQLLTDKCSFHDQISIKYYNLFYYVFLAHEDFICLFVLRFNVPVDNVSVISGGIRSHCFLGINQYCGELMCLAQGHNTVPCMGFKPRASRFGHSAPHEDFEAMSSSIMIKQKILLSCAFVITHS